MVEASRLDEVRQERLREEAARAAAMATEVTRLEAANALWCGTVRESSEKSPILPLCMQGSILSCKGGGGTHIRDGDGSRGLRGGVDKTRHGDIAVLDYTAPKKDQLMDGVVTTVYRNTRQRETRVIPGYVAKLVEDRTFYADNTSERPIARINGGRHILVPFAVEDGGQLGAHAQSFLRALAERAVHQGHRSRRASCDPNGVILRSDGGSHVSIWVQRLHRHISSWPRLSLSMQLLRLY